jgi:hypothetical protein
MDDIKSEHIWKLKELAVTYKRAEPDEQKEMPEYM